MDDKLMQALFKSAKGYRYNEVHEEYVVNKAGTQVLKKKKVVRKYCPPDTNAMKVYMAVSNEKSIADLSDEELKIEQQKIVESIKKQMEKEERKK